MIGRRAFTLVELLIVTAITATIVGALGGLFVFVGTRAAQTMAKNGVLLQAQALAEELDATFSQAQDCRVLPIRTGVNAIQCVLPTSGTDSDGDGVIDLYTPEWVGPTGREGFGLGKRVWFYMSDPTGSPTSARTSGGVLWRAWRSDDSLPTNADIDRSFAYYYDRTVNKWNLIDRVDWKVSGDGTVTYTIVANKLRRAERRASGSDTAAEQETFTMTRTVLCKNWRK